MVGSGTVVAEAPVVDELDESDEQAEPTMASVPSATATTTDLMPWVAVRTGGPRFVGWAQTAASLSRQSLPRELFEEVSTSCGSWGPRRGTPGRRWDRPGAANLYTGWKTQPETVTGSRTSPIT